MRGEGEGQMREEKGRKRREEEKWEKENNTFLTCLEVTLTLRSFCFQGFAQR